MNNKELIASELAKVIDSLDPVSYTHLNLPLLFV